LIPKGGTNTTVLFSSEGAKNQRALRWTPPSSSITTAIFTSTSTTTKQKVNEQQNSKNHYFGALYSFNVCPVSYNGPPIYRDGGRWRFSPKPLVVIFFRAPGGRGISKKPLEPTQRPTNPYMGWATPPTLPNGTGWVHRMFLLDIWQSTLVAAPRAPSLPVGVGQSLGSLVP
jgi:hypothetical protein